MGAEEAVATKSWLTQTLEGSQLVDASGSDVTRRGAALIDI